MTSQRWAIGVLLASLTASSLASHTWLRQSTIQQHRNTQTCGIPTFSGDWEPVASYPFALIESHGGFLDTNGNFLVVGGYEYPDASRASAATYVLDTANANAVWLRNDPYPIPEGITHGAMATDTANGRFFLCGGYVGGNPGPATDLCFFYNYQTIRWEPLPSLPEPRGAGGLVYNANDGSLIFSSGAQRVSVGAQDSVDFGTTWVLPSGGTAWTTTSDDSPLLGNHVSSVAAPIGNGGDERYFFFGGQVAENEADENLDTMVEFDSATGTWTTRASLPQPVGHANAAAVPFANCGLLIAGGSVNGEVNFMQRILAWLSQFFNAFTFGLFDNTFLRYEPTPRRAMTADISYYDIATDTWTEAIGQLESEAKTAVCDISGDWLYCGLGGTETMYRRQIVMPVA